MTTHEYTQILTHLISLLWSQERKLKMQLVVAVLFSGLAIAVNMVLPVMFKTIVAFGEHVLAQQIWFLTILIAYCVMWTVSRIMFPLREILVTRVVERSITQLSHDFVAHLYQLPMSYFTDQRIGDLSSMLERATAAIPTVIYGFFFFLVPTTIEMLVAMVLFYNFYGVGYAALLLVLFASFISFSLFASKGRSDQRKERNKIQGEVASYVTDVLLNFEMITYFGSQQRELKQYGQLLKQKEGANTKSHLSFGVLYLGHSIIIGIGFLAFTLLVGYDIMYNNKAIGDLVLVHGFLLQFFMPLGAFGMILRDAYRSFIDMERLFNVFEVPAMVEHVPEIISSKKQSGAIEFKNVTFGYEDKPLVLHGASFKIPAGKTAVLVGPTGSGKSTIIKLLYRFYDLLDGEILIDECNINDMPRSAIAHLLGIVPQDPFLFNNSIAYNISYGKPGAREDEIVAVAQRAHIHSMVDALPKRYATHVGEQGAKLSRGERQRIAFARAILKDPSVYIFDEATASLDEYTKRVVHEHMYNACKGKTTLIVTHQPSSLDNVDLWLHLKNGMVDCKKN